MSIVIRDWANDEQKWLVERGAAPTLLVGGINSGKTVACVLKGLILLTEYPGSRLLIVRRSYSQLLKTTMESWYQWCLPQFYSPKGNRTEGVLQLNNSSRAYFIHLDQPNSLDLLAGLEANFAYVSQVEEISEKAFDLLDVRVGRWTGATIPDHKFAEFGGRESWPWRSPAGICVPPRYIFAEGYVTDEGHWLYDRFAPESPNREKWKGLGYESKIAFTENNIYAIKQTVDVALTKDEDYIRRYVRPVWGNPEGKIFRIDPKSLLQPETWLLEKILRMMKLHRSLDHGEAVPTCCLWEATDSEGNIFVYREYYQADALVSDHRRAIYSLGMADGLHGIERPKYRSNLADPSIFGKNRGRTTTSRPSWSVADEYTDTRVMEKGTAIYWSPAENDEAATRSRMKEYLKVDPNHRHPVTGEMGAPHLYFVVQTDSYPHGCKMVLRDVRAQVRLKSKSGDREIWLDDRDDTIPDHGYDALKYHVISRPSLGPMEPKPLPVPGEIPLAVFEEADRVGRYRRRLQERRLGVGRAEF